MSKKKKKDDMVFKTEKTIAITAGSINDGFCNYSYEVKNGVGTGDTHNVKGKGLVDPAMDEAFRKLNVHLACIDDVFKHSGTEVKNIRKMENNELSALYEVSGFQIRGSEDNESIILIGTKQINSGGRIDLKSPRIPIDDNASYKWADDLRECAELARHEVEEYKNGKCTTPEPEEDPAQLSITNLEEVEEDEFENAKVK